MVSVAVVASRRAFVSWRCRSLGCVLVFAVTSGCDGDVPQVGEGDGADGGMLAPLTGVPSFDEAPLAIPDDDGSCTAQSHRATSVPIDIALMLDTSGSMLGRTTGGRTKWGAVTTAIASFLSDERTQGVEIGLQYFPLPDVTVAGACSSHDDCGPAGPCSVELCSESFLPCDEHDDCQGGTDECVPIGACEVDQNNSDSATNGSGYVGLFCRGSGATDCNGGVCEPLLQGVCTGGNVCVGASYAEPEVPIAPLDQSGPAIISSMMAHQPQGGTPTGPAMAGLLQWTTENVRDRPHQTVAVMATDGEPTSCDPQDIPQIGAIAAQGLDASPPISTYIIGVVGPGETNLVGNLHALAVAGGTEEAIILNSNADLAQQFLEALYRIRQASLPCAFDLPSSSEVRLDYDKVNVEFFTPLSLPSVLYYVGSHESCAMDQGGWFYDVDPESGETPSRIFLCDAVCGQLRAVSQARVDFKVGCDRRDLR